SSVTASTSTSVDSTRDWPSDSIESNSGYGSAGEPDSAASSTGAKSIGLSSFAHDSERPCASEASGPTFGCASATPASILAPQVSQNLALSRISRSEERRVGKECGC